MKKITNTYSKNFKLIILGQVVSIFGAAILRFALSLYILDITGRADMFAIFFAISSIPVLFSPLGGAIADRFNRRNLMVLIDFSNSFVVLCFFLLLVTGNATIFAIGIVMVLLTAINSIESPTVSSCIPLLVEKNMLEHANGIVQAVQALSSVAAPIIGGILYGMMGINVLVIMSFVTFILAAFMEIFITIPFIQRVYVGNIVTTIIKDMKDGFIYVIKQPFILKSMFLAAMINLVLSPLLIVGGPIVLRVTMHCNDTIYGVGTGLISFASILGALTIGFFSKKLKESTLYRWIVTITLMIVPIIISVLPHVLKLGSYPSFIIFMSGAIPMAMMATIISVYIIARVQRVTSEENLGKVMAIIMAVAQCAAPLGQVIYGVIFELFSNTLYLPILAVGLLMLVIALIAKQMFKAESRSQ